MQTCGTRYATTSTSTACKTQCAKPNIRDATCTMPAQSGPTSKSTFPTAWIALPIARAIQSSLLPAGSSTAVLLQVAVIMNNLLHVVYVILLFPSCYVISFMPGVRAARCVSRVACMPYPACHVCGCRMLSTIGDLRERYRTRLLLRALAARCDFRQQRHC